VAETLQHDIDAALPAVLGFSEEFGEGHFIFAMHSALPLGLTSDLAHLIRVNFAPEVPWVAEADLLLSPLCRPVGKDLWEIEPEIRELLLDELRQDDEFGEDRLQQVAAFVYNYCSLAARRQASNRMREYFSSQQLVALSYVSPEAAAKRLAQQIDFEMTGESRSSTLRVTKLIRTLGEPLYTQRDLSVYAAAVDSACNRQLDDAAALFGQLGPLHEPVNIGGVRLPPPNTTIQSLVGPQDEEPASAQEEPAEHVDDMENTCFVIMGLGTKTDRVTERTLDLDKTYKSVIRPAVEDAGLNCVRIDEMMHVGVADEPAFDFLLSAAFVIADLSTANPDALYQLGVRHALRPNSTIVIAEQNFDFPFGLTGIAIEQYEHLGRGLDVREANRLRRSLATALHERRSAENIQSDSPVYQYLDIAPPYVDEQKDDEFFDRQLRWIGAPSKDRSSPGRCFVVSGLGRKTDNETGRVVDFDRAYREFIRPAVEELGFECSRIDDVMHSGIVDSPTYHQLYSAELVIVDISILDSMVLYQLGVRHGLRPNMTIVIADGATKIPFDIRNVRVLSHEAFGAGVDKDNVIKTRRMLQDTVSVSMRSPVTDSPVYAWLDKLVAPQPVESLDLKADRLAAEQEGLIETALDEAETLRENRQFADARALLTSFRDESGTDDPRVIRELAHVTYLSGSPNPPTALREARDLLLPLHPEKTDDIETIGLWAEIHEELWKSAGVSEDLDAAIEAFGRVYTRTDDRRLALRQALIYGHLLCVRASQDQSPSREADSTRANDVYREAVTGWEEEIKAATSAGEDSTILFILYSGLAEAQVGAGMIGDLDAVLQSLGTRAPSAELAKFGSERIRKVDQLVNSIGLHAPDRKQKPRIVVSSRPSASSGTVNSIVELLEDAFGAGIVFSRSPLNVDDVGKRPSARELSEAENQVAAADVVLAIIDSDWLSAADDSGQRLIDDPQDMTRVQLEAALRFGKALVPVLVETQLPSPKELPAALQDILRYQAVEVLATGRIVEDLIDVVRAHLDEKAEASSPASQSKATGESPQQTTPEAALDVDPMAKIEFYDAFGLVLHTARPEGITGSVDEMIGALSEPLWGPEATARVWADMEGGTASWLRESIVPHGESMRARASEERKELADLPLQEFLVSAAHLFVKAHEQAASESQSSVSAYASVERNTAEGFMRHFSDESIEYESSGDGSSDSLRTDLRGVARLCQQLAERLEVQLKEVPVQWLPSQYPETLTLMKVLDAMYGSYGYYVQSAFKAQRLEFLAGWHWEQFVVPSWHTGREQWAQHGLCDQNVSEFDFMVTVLGAIDSYAHAFAALSSTESVHRWPVDDFVGELAQITRLEVTQVASGPASMSTERQELTGPLRRWIEAAVYLRPSLEVQINDAIAAREQVTGQGPATA